MQLLLIPDVWAGEGGELPSLPSGASLWDTKRIGDLK